MAQTITIDVSTPLEMVQAAMTRQDQVLLFGVTKATTPQEKMELFKKWFNAVMANAKNGSPKALRCKVAEKGGVSVYGLATKWPVTLYAEQWERLIAYIPTLQEFITANSDSLSRKTAA